MTTSADLIAAFEDRVTLPIDLNEVAQWLLDRSIQNEIKFVPVDLDIGVIRGFLKRFRRAKGGWDIDPDEVSHIYYDRTQGAEWINIVCAKELLHILDAALCATREEYERLTRSLALPNDIKHLLESPVFAVVDKFGDIPAAALMLPKAARDALLPAYTAGLLPDDVIANMAMIPVKHAQLVMSPEWEFLYETVMAKRTPPDEWDDRPAIEAPDEPDFDFDQAPAAPKED